MAYDTINKQFTGQAAVGMTCWCSIQFAVPRSLYEFYDRSNEERPGSVNMHCPLGHSMVPAGKTAAQREAAALRDELAREKHRREQAESDAQYQRNRVVVRDRQVAARKGQLTKLRKRIEKGVCPCCNRYFENVHRHMTTQHPAWSPESDAAILTPPESLSPRFHHAWLAGAQAAPDAANPYKRHGRGIKPHDAWNDGRAAASPTSA